MIVLNDVTYKYDDRRRAALDNVSLRIERGDWISVVGANGSGKSTLVKLLMGILESYEGDVSIDGTKVTEENTRALHKNFSIVLQNPDNQFVGATVEDDVAFSLENLEIPRAEMLEIVDAVLKEVDMFEYKKHEPSRLSGGQKQRVAIAGALATDPDVLILDEATSMLDPQGRRDVLKLLQSVHRKRKTTIIYVTHDLTEVFRSDAVIVMNQGQVRLKGSVDTIYSNPHILEENNLVLPFEIKISTALLNQSIMSYAKLVRKL